MSLDSELARCREEVLQLERRLREKGAECTAEARARKNMEMQLNDARSTNDHLMTEISKYKDEIGLLERKIHTLETSSNRNDIRYSGELPYSNAGEVVTQVAKYENLWREELLRRRAMELDLQELQEAFESLPMMEKELNEAKSQLQLERQKRKDMEKNFKERVLGLEVVVKEKLQQVQPNAAASSQQMAELQAQYEQALSEMHSALLEKNSEMEKMHQSFQAQWEEREQALSFRMQENEAALREVQAAADLRVQSSEQIAREAEEMLFKTRDLLKESHAKCASLEHRISSGGGSGQATHVLEARVSALQREVDSANRAKDTLQSRLDQQTKLTRDLEQRLHKGDSSEGGISTIPEKWFVELRTFLCEKLLAQRSVVQNVLQMVITVMEKGLREASDEKIRAVQEQLVSVCRRHGEATDTLLAKLNEDVPERPPAQEQCSESVAELRLQLDKALRDSASLSARLSAEQSPRDSNASSLEIEELKSALRKEEEATQRSWAEVRDLRKEVQQLRDKARTGDSDNRSGSARHSPVSHHQGEAPLSPALVDALASLKASAQQALETLQDNNTHADAVMVQLQEATTTQAQDAQEALRGTKSLAGSVSALCELLSSDSEVKAQAEAEVVSLEETIQRVIAAVFSAAYCVHQLVERSQSRSLASLFSDIHAKACHCLTLPLPSPSPSAAAVATTTSASAASVLDPDDVVLAQQAEIDRLQEQVNKLQAKLGSHSDKAELTALRAEVAASKGLAERLRAAEESAREAQAQLREAKAQVQRHTDSQSERRSSLSSSSELAALHRELLSLTAAQLTSDQRVQELETLLREAQGSHGANGGNERRSRRSSAHSRTDGSTGDDHHDGHDDDGLGVIVIEDEEPHRASPVPLVSRSSDEAVAHYRQNEARLRSQLQAMSTQFEVSTREVQKSNERAAKYEAAAKRFEVCNRDLEAANRRVTYLEERLKNAEEHQQCAECQHRASSVSEEDMQRYAACKKELEAANHRLRRLEAELNANHLSNLQVELESAKTALHESRSDADQLRQKVSQLTAALLTAKEDADSQRAQLQQALAENAQLSRDLRMSDEPSVEGSSVAEPDPDTARLVDELAIAQQVIAMKAETLESLQTALAEKEAACQAHTADFDQKLFAFTQEVSNKDNLISDLTEQLEQLRANKQRLTEAASSAERNHATALARVAELETKLKLATVDSGKSPNAGALKRLQTELRQSLDRESNLQETLDQELSNLRELEDKWRVAEHRWVVLRRLQLAAGLPVDLAAIDAEDSALLPLHGDRLEAALSSEEQLAADLLSASRHSGASSPHSFHTDTSHTPAMAASS